MVGGSVEIWHLIDDYIPWIRNPKLHCKYAGLTVAMTDVLVE